MQDYGRSSSGRPIPGEQGALAAAAFQHASGGSGGAKTTVKKGEVVDAPFQIKTLADEKTGIMRGHREFSQKGEPLQAGASGLVRGRVGRNAKENCGTMTKSCTKPTGSKT